MLSTALRLIDLLRAIPGRGQGATASELRKALEAEGWKVHARTVQRDLQDLSARFPLETGGRPPRWRWSETRQATQIPGLDVTGAVIWSLIERHLIQMLPPAFTKELKPQFVAAADVLSRATKGRASWPRRIAAISTSYPLISPPVDERTLQTVGEALIQELRFEATYRARYEKKSKTFEVNPLGLLLRDRVVYLVATLWDYEEIVQLALHRIQSVKSLTKTARIPPGFKMEEYSRGPTVRFPVSDRKLKLRLCFAEEAGFHLTEAKLAEDQRVRQLANSSYLVEATVADTAQLRWWLLGFGASVEVLAPAGLRREIGKQALDMARRYSGRS